MLPRRLMGCLRLATVGSRAERLAFFRTSIVATTGDRFSSTTSSAGRSGASAHGEPKNGYKGSRRAPAVDGSSVSGGRHITSTAVRAEQSVVVGGEGVLQPAGWWRRNLCRSSGSLQCPCASSNVFLVGGERRARLFALRCRGSREKGVMQSVVKRKL